jgi:hypothetical protein
MQFNLSGLFAVSDEKNCNRVTNAIWAHANGDRVASIAKHRPRHAT